MALTRSRASLLQVRTLYPAIRPLCEELIALDPEHRSKLFWAHWSSVSGDRGVDHKFIEDLLPQNLSVELLAAELIAHVYEVNRDSVEMLMNKIDISERATDIRVPIVPKN